MSGHTQGRLSLGEFSTSSAYLLNRRGSSIAIVTSPSMPQTGEAHANARRLVACWNVCDGLDTDYIEYAARTNNFVGAVQWLTAERDQALAINAELLAALEIAEAEIAQVQQQECHVFGDDPDVLEKVRAAIAKAKGGAA